MTDRELKLGDRVTVPPSYREGAISDPFVALLGRLSDSRVALEEERRLRESAANVAWVEIVDALVLMEKNLISGEAPPSAPSSRTELHKVFSCFLRRFYDDHGLEICDPLGLIFEDLAAGEFEVAATQLLHGDQKHHEVVRVVRVAVRRHGELARTGKVVLGAKEGGER